MPQLFLDFETRSACDLKACGAYVYAEDPSTEAICCYLEHSSGWRVLWTPIPYEGWVPPEGVVHRWGIEWLQQVFSEPGLVAIAHNAEFDKNIAEITYKLPRVTWIDTMALAMYCSLPGGLDDIGSTLFGMGKDKSGYQLMLKLCKPGRGGKYPEITFEILTRLVIYNITDVALMRRLLDERGGYWHDSEEGVYFVHQKINTVGVPLNLPLARGLERINAALIVRVGLGAEEATRNFSIAGRAMPLRLADLTRVQYLKDWFNTVGGPNNWSIDCVDEETMRQIIAAPAAQVDPVVKLVAEARLSVSRASLKKVISAQMQCSRDGRLRGSYVYYGAHTGRWTSRGMQIHNLPRPNPYLTDEDLRKPERPQAELVKRLIDACCTAGADVAAPADAVVNDALQSFIAAVGQADAYAQAKSGGKDHVSLEDAFTSLIRPILVPSSGKVFVGSDFAQVEGRGAAWEANDVPALEAYRNYDAGTGPHVYAKMATVIFGRTVTKKDKIEYQVGKVSELGATYGMGPDKFDMQNHDALAAAGVDARTAIYGWRDLHRITVRYWRELEMMMKSSIVSKRAERAGPFVFDTPHHGMWTTATLPSGRQIFYHLARAHSDESGSSRLQYRSYRKDGSPTQFTWGGTLLENLTQALCRDAEAEKMVEFDREGLPLVMHTHDEIVAEVDAADGNEAAEYMERQMSVAPAWAPGFPLKAEAAVMERYTK